MPPIVGVPAFQCVVGRPVDADLLADPPADEPAQQYRRPEAGHQDRHWRPLTAEGSCVRSSALRPASSSTMTARSLNSIDWSPVCWTDS